MDVTILAVDQSAAIRKVLEMTLTRAGYQVVIATTGEEALARVEESSPDLVLYDYALPRMNGFQFCTRLQRIDRRIPVILMASREDELSSKFVERMGIVDYMTKPFTPEVLLTVTAHALRKYPKDRVIEETPLQEEEPTSEEREATKRAEEEAAIIAGVKGQITQRLLRALVGKYPLFQQRISPQEFRALLSEGINEALPERFLQNLARDLSRGSITEMSGERISLEGDIEMIPIAEIFQLLTLQSQTGVLLIVRGNTKVMLFFREGNIDFATGKNVDRHLLLGRFLLESHKISEEELRELLLEKAKHKRPLGQLVLQHGKLTREELHEILRTQTSELVYSVLRWPSGRYYFVVMDHFPRIVREAAFGIPTQNLLMEGYRQVDEWHLIEREINNFDLVLHPNPAKQTEENLTQLTEEERKILSLVDGQNTVRDIVKKSHMRPFTVCKQLYSFISTKMITKV